MKKFTLATLWLYQHILSPFLHQLLGVRHACRYSPTCSEYAKMHIAHDGVLRGSVKSLLRLLYCQPFAQNLPIALRK